ncbi:helix-turn-helix domain-containing protein [Amycolatopsis nigrescens]|uniref:helix-turn-helix domain-containing protein n=1 Tax=Amycolatopsis nigrescens TaxID=381445 RepID=UPI003CCC20FD
MKVRATRKRLGGSDKAQRRAVALKLKAAYEAGATTQGIAVRFGFARTTVRNLLHEVDTAMRPPGAQPLEPQVQL